MFEAVDLIIWKSTAGHLLHRSTSAKFYSPPPAPLQSHSSTDTALYDAIFRHRFGEFALVLRHLITLVVH